MQNWNLPLRWNRSAERERAAGVLWAGRPGFWPVFCASLADVFDNEVPVEWRFDLFRLIRQTPFLTWLLVTKRIGNARTMLPAEKWDNVWLGVTAVNQDEVDRDVPKLLSIAGVAKRFVSYEPALGPVDWTHWLPEPGLKTRTTSEFKSTPALAWIIVGGESAQGGAAARTFDISWASSTIAQCKGRAAVFVKQLGAAPEWNDPDPDNSEPPHWLAYKFKDRAGADPFEWPADLRVREFPL